MTDDKFKSYIATLRDPLSSREAMNSSLAAIEAARPGVPMSEPRFRSPRCVHGLLIGLCEDRSCEGWDQARVDEAKVKRVKPPRCSECKQKRGDAVPRTALHLVGRKRPRWCNDCWEKKQIRDATAAERAASPWPWRRGGPRRSDLPVGAHVEKE